MNSLTDSGGREGQRGVRSEGESCGGDQGKRETGKGKSIYTINSLLLYTLVFCSLFAIQRSKKLQYLLKLVLLA